jgi:hypothetical protein
VLDYEPDLSGSWSLVVPARIVGEGTSRIELVASYSTRASTVHGGAQALSHDWDVAFLISSLRIEPLHANPG